MQYYMYVVNEIQYIDRESMNKKLNLNTKTE